jgi:hypothetical protein
MTATTEIETGVKTANTCIESEDYDAVAFADNGEHATVWAVSRLSDTGVAVRYFRCEAGLQEQDGPTAVFEVAPDTTVTEFAREVSQADPELAVELAEDYWG